MCKGPEVGLCLLRWRDVTEARHLEQSEGEDWEKKSEWGRKARSWRKLKSRGRLWLFL